MYKAEDSAQTTVNGKANSLLGNAPKLNSSFEHGRTLSKNKGDMCTALPRGVHGGNETCLAKHLKQAHSASATHTVTV